jgi:hypothetical protein
MPTGMNETVGQDWGTVNVGSASSYKRPTSARGIDAAKKAGKMNTELRCVSFGICHGIAINLILIFSISV